MIPGETNTDHHIYIDKVPCNVYSDWLNQHALSVKRARVDDSKLAFKFRLHNFDKFDPNLISLVTQTNKMETRSLSVVSMALTDHF